MTDYPQGIDWGDAPDVQKFLDDTAPPSDFSLSGLLQPPVDLGAVDWGDFWNKVLWFGYPPSQLATDSKAWVAANVRTPAEAMAFAQQGFASTVSDPIDRAVKGAQDAVTGALQGAAQGVQDAAGQAARDAAAQAANVALIGGAGLLVFFALQKIAR